MTKASSNAASVVCVFVCLVVTLMSAFVLSGVARDDRQEDDVVVNDAGGIRSMIVAVDVSDPSDEDAAKLIAILNDSAMESETRRLAAFSLARIGNPELATLAVPKLIEQLQSEDKSQVAWSAKSLAMFGADAAESAPALIGLLQHSDHAIRNGSIDALSKIGTAHPQVVMAIHSRLQTLSRQPVDNAQDQLSLEFLIDAVSSMGPDAAPCLPCVIRFLDSAKSRIRTAAANAVGSMGPRGDIAVPNLVERLVVDESPEVRDASAAALSKLGMASIRPLERMLNSKDPEIVNGALVALGNIGPAAKQVLPGLVSKCESSDTKISLSAADSVLKVSNGMIDISPVLMRLLETDDRTTRMSAVKLFSKAGDHARTPKVRSQLEQLAENGSSVARQAAGVVLRRFGRQTDSN